VLLEEGQRLAESCRSRGKHAMQSELVGDAPNVLTRLVFADRRGEVGLGQPHGA
jgi:hypothetical protein